MFLFGVSTIGVVGCLLQLLSRCGACLIIVCSVYELAGMSQLQIRNDALMKGIWPVHLHTATATTYLSVLSSTSITWSNQRVTVSLAGL